MTDKHFTYDAKNGKKYKVSASHFLGNIGDSYGYLFTISTHSGAFEFVVRVSRDAMLKKWKLPNRTKEEETLIHLGGVLVKRELDRSNEQNGYKINFTDSMAKETLEKTLKSLD